MDSGALPKSGTSTSRKTWPDFSPCSAATRTMYRPGDSGRRESRSGPRESGAGFRFIVWRSLILGLPSRSYASVMTVTPPGDRVLCNLPGAPRHVRIEPRIGIVHQDGHDAAVLGFIIRHHVERRLAQPRGRCRDGRRHVDRGERDDRLRVAVLQNGKVRRRQPPDGTAVLAQHRDVQFHDVDAGPERRELGRRGRLADQHRDREECEGECEAEASIA